MSFLTKTLAAGATLALAAAMAAPSFADTTVNAAQTGTQSVSGSYGQGDDNYAYIDTNAFENVSGNVGVNVAAGNGNQQLNVAHIDNHSPNFVFSGDYEQSVTGTTWDGSSNDTIGGASIDNNAFEYASGNIGANVAAGNINQQQNASFIVADDSLSSEVIYASQYAEGNSCTDCGGNYATIDNHAFDHAAGNLGVNVADGNGNQQINSLTIASTNAGQNVDIEQTQGASDGEVWANTYDGSGGNDASIVDNAFAHAAGNIGVNVTAGNGNQQANRAEILTMDSNGSQSTTVNQSQSGLSANGAGLNSAYLSNNAFQNATGNIGVNVAAGNGNQQANALTVIP